MRHLNLLHSFTFPLALDEKVEVTFPIGNVMQSLRFSVDQDLKGTETRLCADSEGRHMLALPNQQGNNYLGTSGYNDQGRLMFWSITIQALAGTNLVTAALMEERKPL